MVFTRRVGLALMVAAAVAGAAACGGGSGGSGAAPAGSPEGRPAAEAPSGGPPSGGSASGGSPSGDSAGGSSGGGKLAIGSNPAGSGAHSMASALAAVATENSDYTVGVQATTGPGAWLPAMSRGEVEFGIINTLDAHFAITGTVAYDKPHPFLRLVHGGVYPFQLGLLVKKDSGIESLADLKGKRVATDFGGHAINQTFLEAMLATDGLTLADVRAVPVPSFNDGVKSLAEGRSDAAIGSIGSGVVEEANAAAPVRYLPLPQDDRAVAAVAERAPGAGITILKGGSVTGAEVDTPVLGYPLGLATSTQVDEQAIYDLTKLWWEQNAKLTPIHPLMQKWTHESAVLLPFTVPYHEGAVRFYKEVGAWSDEAEKLQQELLGKYR